VRPCHPIVTAARSTCERPRFAEDWRPLNRTELFLAILGLIVLEIYHLKWIWWEYWVCRSCNTKNKNCPCEAPRWFTYL
jgi:hypothetical protein